MATMTTAARLMMIMILMKFMIYDYDNDCDGGDVQKINLIGISIVVKVTMFYK